MEHIAKTKLRFTASSVSHVDENFENRADFSIVKKEIVQVQISYNVVFVFELCNA